MMRRRNGLTLPEVLVTLAIVAVVAAVLVPALTSQISKGDAGRVAEDLKAIQTGVLTFAADVRRYPASLTQLTNIISTSQADLSSGTSYTSPHVEAWRGPYFVKEITPGATTFRTGFRGSVETGLLNQNLNSVPHVAVRLTGLSEAERDAVDKLLDDGVSSTGTFRFVSPTGTLYFAAVIQ